MCLAARTAGKGPLGTGTGALGSMATASAPHHSRASCSPTRLQAQPLPAYLGAHLPKLLQEEALSLQELPHHGLSTGKVPILAVREQGGSRGQHQVEWAGAQANHPNRSSQGSDTGL